MDNKKILLVFIVIFAIAVNASAAVMINTNTVKVGGLDFKLPEGFTENETDTHHTDSSAYDGHFPVKVTESTFTNGSDKIYIGVMDCGSPDNAKKAYDKDTSGANSTKTIMGHNGTYAEKNGACAFQYCNGKYNIRILATDESLLEGAVF